MPMLEKEAPHVVILGAGFAGLAVAKRLAREKVRITLIDRSNHHLFQPLLYQVAAAAWLWLFVHLLGLVEFRRRFAVITEWAWAYFTWQRRSRVILEVPAEPRSPRSSSYPATRPSLRTGS